MSVRIWLSSTCGYCAQFKSRLEAGLEARLRDAGFDIERVEAGPDASEATIARFNESQVVGVPRVDLAETATTPALPTPVSVAMTDDDIVMTLKRLQTLAPDLVTYVHIDQVRSFEERDDIVRSALQGAHEAVKAQTAPMQGGHHRRRNEVRII